MIALLALATASAQEDASLCKGGFTDVDWRVRLKSAEDALGSLEVEVARRLLERTREQMVCLDHVADPALLAELARDLAWLAFVDQDEAGAVRWLLLARGTAPGAMPEAFPEGLRALDADTPDAPIVGTEDRLVPPKGGALFLDGKLLLEPRAAAEVPGLLQVADGDGEIVSTAWIDSGVLPPEWLGAPGPPPKTPRWYEAGASSETVTVERANTGPAVLPLVASGGLAVLAGTFYALGAASTGGLERAGTEDQLAAARSRTNLLAMGSMALGAGAVGVGVTAFVVSGDASVRISFRF